MSPDGVGDALRKIYRALRPTGLLLDLHPMAERPVVEVGAAGLVQPIGRLDDPTLTENVRGAERVRAELLAAGVYLLERTTIFDFIYHFDTVDAWLSYAANQWTDAQIDEGVVTTARALLGRGGDFRIRHRISAARLRRGIRRVSVDGAGSALERCQRQAI